MSENKITMTIKPAQAKNTQMDGMIALKKIEHYTYALNDEIGLGFSSHVYKGKNQHTNQTVAVKVIDLKKEDELSRQFMNDEINILEAIKAKNPVNLLRLYDVFKTKNNLYIITEFCEGKDVAKILRKKKILNEVEAQSILRQLMNAYRELYELGVVHRDLKLANVFVRKGIVKLADFGFAIDYQKCQQKFDYNVGSPYYMPPQALKFNRYSFKSDVWSFGILAFEMVYGHLPWKEKIESVLFEKITTHPIQEMFEPDVHITDHYKHFVRSCLQIDYDRRATPEFIINYEWPLAQQYVEGFDNEGTPAGSYKPLTMVRVPSADHQVIGQNKNVTSSAFIKPEDRQQRPRLGQQQQPFQNRDRSPANRTQHRIVHPSQVGPERHKTVFQQSASKPQQQHKPQMLFHSVDTLPKRQIEQPPSLPSPPASRQMSPSQASSNAEACILSQIYYCKFMSNLCDLLQQNSKIQEVYLLKAELVNRILGKFEALMKMREGQNIYQVEGFHFYKVTDKWMRLKDIIQKYFERYREKYPIEFKSQYNDQVLLNAIKHLKNNLGGNFSLLQELTYFYQLKELERRQSLTQFSINSKLELLSNRRLAYRQQAPNSVLCERLNTRLALLGF